MICNAKMNWAAQVSSSISNVKKALNWINLIRKLFFFFLWLQIIPNNFYFILHYKLEAWQIPWLTQNLHHSFFAASAYAIKLSLHYPPVLHSYHDLTKLPTKAMPKIYSYYKLSMLLYKTFNNEYHSSEWIHLNCVLTITSRQSTFMSCRYNKNRVGLNCLTNSYILIEYIFPLTGSTRA
jgi:hypothetical protein